MLFFPFQFLVAEEKKEEVAAPPAEDTGDVDDLVCFLYICRMCLIVCLLMGLACWDL